MLVYDPPRLNLETGEVLEHTPEIQRLTNENRYLHTELEAAQDEITKLLVQVKKLKTQNDNAVARTNRRAEIQALFAEWQAVCNKHRCKLREAGDRFKALDKALGDGYTPEQIRVAFIGAMHNHPWPLDPKRGPMLELATILRDRFIEQFHDAGADWLQQAGHAAPEKFSGPATQLAQLAVEFRKANQRFNLHADGKHADALCPVCMTELTVSEAAPRARMECLSGCDRRLIVAALLVKQGVKQGRKT